MSANITANSKDALVAAVKTVWDRIDAVLGTGGYQDTVDDLLAEPGSLALPSEGKANLLDSVSNHRDDLAQIKARGRGMIDPILIQMGREANSRVLDGEFVADWNRLFRDINADLLGGTPDYVDPRAVSLAANPAASATGIFRRLIADYLGEPIEDGHHGNSKVIRIVSKPARYQSTALVEGRANTFGDDLDYRGGRTFISGALRAYNDATTPPGIFNPYFVPNDLTNGVTPTSFANWTMALTGTPTFTVDTTVLWRSRAHSIKFLGANTTALELSQVIPASVFGDPFHPWAIGCPVRLETGWQGTIDVTWGGKTQQFTHADLTNGSFKHLFLDMDKDLYPVNFDAAGAMFKIKFTNGQLNTNAIWFTAFIPQPMVVHENVWYSHFSDTSEPTVESTVTLADTCTFAGKIQDVVAFLYQDTAPGDAHLPSSGATTITDPA